MSISNCYICRFVTILTICYGIFLGRHACLPIYPIVISAGFVMSFLVTNACLYPIVIIYLQVRHVLPDEVPP